MSIASLVKIKALREEKAERAVRAQRRLRDEAVADRDDAGRRLDEFRAFAQAQEQALYRSLCERVVKRQDIEDAQADVRQLRAREADHEDAFDAAESRREAEERQLDADRQTHAHAMRQREKFVELAHEAARAARVQAEAREDADLDEVAETCRPSVRTFPFISGDER